MADQADATTQRLSELVAALDGLADQTAASLARELLQRVLELHGAALSRIIATIGADRQGSSLLESLARDDAVAAVLLLHGLHPRSLEQRIDDALRRLHARLAVQGMAVDGVEIVVDRVRVRLRLADTALWRNAQADQIRREVEQAVLAAAPDLGSLEIDGLPAAITLVPVSSIGNRSRSDSAALTR